MTPERTPAGKWVLYEVATGRRVERWPVDGRQMIETGGHTATPPDGHIAPAATVAPGSSTVLPPELPAEHSPGVPLIAATEGVPASPIADLSPDAPKAKGRRRR